MPWASSAPSTVSPSSAGADWFRSATVTVRLIEASDRRRHGLISLKYGNQTVGCQTIGAAAKGNETGGRKAQGRQHGHAARPHRLPVAAPAPRDIWQFPPGPVWLGKFPPAVPGSLESVRPH